MGKRLQKSSCVKLEGTGLIYLVCHFIKAVFYVRFLFHQIKAKFHTKLLYDTETKGFSNCIGYHTHMFHSLKVLP